MRKLSIFDDGVRIATITQIDGSIFLFARSTREWHAMKTLIRYAYEADPKDASFLGHLARKAHDNSYSTELVDE